MAYNRCPYPALDVEGSDVHEDGRSGARDASTLMDSTATVVAVFQVCLFV